MNYSSDTKIQQHKIKTKCPKITPRYQTFAFQIHSLFFSTLLSFLPHYWPPLVLGFQGKIGFWLDLAMEILARGQKQEVGLGMGLLQFSCILPIKGHSSCNLPSLRALFLQVLVGALASHHFCPRGGEVFRSRCYYLQGTAPYPLVSLNLTQFLQTALY